MNEPIDHTEAREAEQLADVFTRIFQRNMTERLLEADSVADVTPVQLQALAFLGDHGTCSVRAIGEGLRISFPAATRLVDRLVRKCLVSRRENPHDRRLADVSLTAEGAGLLRRVREERTALVGRALSRLSGGERRRLMEDLKAFIRAALESEEDALEVCQRCGIRHSDACVVNQAYQAFAGSGIPKP